MYYIKYMYMEYYTISSESVGILCSRVTRIPGMWDTSCPNQSKCDR